MADPLQSVRTTQEVHTVIKHVDLALLTAHATTALLLNLPPEGELTTGVILRVYRAMSGLKIAALATMSGVDRGQISLIERDKVDPSFESIDKLENIFGPKFKSAMLQCRGRETKKRRRK